MVMWRPSDWEPIPPVHIVCGVQQIDICNGLLRLAQHICTSAQMHHCGTLRATQWLDAGTRQRSHKPGVRLKFIAYKFAQFSFDKVRVCAP